MKCYTEGGVKWILVSVRVHIPLLTKKSLIIWLSLNIVLYYIGINGKYLKGISKYVHSLSINKAFMIVVYRDTRYVRKVMRLIRENSFNWRCGYTHLIFFKITSLSINAPLPAVLRRVVARLEVLNWVLFQSIRHGSLHVFNNPKMVPFQAGFEPGKQKEIGRDSPGLGRFIFFSPGQIQLERAPFWDC